MLGAKSNRHCLIIIEKNKIYHLPSIVLQISVANNSVNDFTFGNSSTLSNADNDDDDKDDDGSHILIANAIKFIRR